MFGIKRLKARVNEMEARHQWLVESVKDTRAAECEVCGGLGIASKMVVVHIPERVVPSGYLVPEEYAATLPIWAAYVAGIVRPRVHIHCLAGSKWDRRKESGKTTLTFQVDEVKFEKNDRRKKPSKGRGKK